MKLVSILLITLLFTMVASKIKHHHHAHRTERTESKRTETKRAETKAESASESQHKSRATVRAQEKATYEALKATMATERAKLQAKAADMKAKMTSEDSSNLEVAKSAATASLEAAAQAASSATAGLTAGATVATSAGTSANTAQPPIDNDGDGNQICLLVLVPHYDICKRINECGLCTISPHCGWCIADKQQRCMPGGKAQSACPNGPDHCDGSDWIFDVAACEGIPRNQAVSMLLNPGQVHMGGAFTNMAPEARHFISPEIANKNYAVSVTNEGGMSQFFLPMNGARTELALHGTRKLRRKRRMLKK